MFRKHLSLFTINFINSFQWRAEIIVWIFLSIIPTLIIFLVWQNIFSSGQTINGYALSQIIEYYLLIVIIHGFTGVHFEGLRSQQIREGKIDHYLTKPVSFFSQVLLTDLGGKFFYLLFSMPFWLSALFILNQHQGLNFALSATNITYFILLLSFGYIVDFFMAFITTTLTFWFEGAEGLQHFKWISISLFSGAMIPVAFMPSWLKNLTQLLPFKYIYAVPIGIIQGFYKLQPVDVIYACSFICFLGLVTKILWSRAAYKYASAGG